jgi:hypothetical protein
VADDGAVPKEEGGGGISALRALLTVNGGSRMGHPSVVMQGAWDGNSDDAGQGGTSTLVAPGAAKTKGTRRGSRAR